MKGRMAQAKRVRSKRQRKQPTSTRRRAKKGRAKKGRTEKSRPKKSRASKSTAKKTGSSPKPAASASPSQPAAAPVDVDRFDADTFVDELRLKGIDRAKIGGFDIDGVLRGKYVSLDKLRSALKKGFGFCDVIFGWDVTDQLYDAATITGWHTGYPDAHAVLDPTTVREIPWEPGVVAMLCDFRDERGKDHPACPRSLLKRIAKRAEKAGYSTKFSAEFEFFFFQETRDSLKDKHFRDLRPLDPGMFGYSWVREGQDRELMQKLWTELLGFDVALEGLHTETGPGVYEAAIAADEIVRAADKAALFKTAVKQIAHHHGVSVTFMAKWNTAFPGSSGHIHQSLWQDKKSAFYDARAKQGLSNTLRHYLGGQMALMRELTVMMSPTINSYKRYVPGLWAPLVPSWGIENRTCALRAIGGGAGSTRVEHRQPAADMNPYLSMAAALGAGLWGIEKELDPGPPTTGDPGLGAPADRLPVSLEHATELFSKSRAARSLFGSAFVEHYAVSRRFEVQSYQRAVTDWELARYFEVI